MTFDYLVYMVATILFALLVVVVHGAEEESAKEIARCTFEDNKCPFVTMAEQRHWGIAVPSQSELEKDHTVNVIGEGHFYRLQIDSVPYPFRPTSETVVGPAMSLPGGTKCLRFWEYFRFTGRLVPEISIGIINTATGKKTNLNTHKQLNSYGEGLQKVEVSFSASQGEYKFELMASWGKDDIGIYIIDDIIMHDKSCAEAEVPYCFNPTQFTCANSKQCIEGKYRCNGHDDCGDSSDENNCDFTNWPLVIGICAGVVLPLLIIGFVICIILCRRSHVQKAEKEKIRKAQQNSDFIDGSRRLPIRTSGRRKKEFASLSGSRDLLSPPSIGTSVGGSTPSLANNPNNSIGVGYPV